MKALIKSSTNISLNLINDQIYDINGTFFITISKKLQEASSLLPYNQFYTIFKQIILKCIKKAQIDPNFSQVLLNIKKWMAIYSYDIQILARVLILQSQIILKQSTQQTLQILTKIKHLVIDSQYQYLLSKVFIIQSKVYDNMGQKQMKYKILKKCVEFVQNYTLQYLKIQNQIRIQILDNMIIAYFEMYKILSKQANQQNHSPLQYLSKAHQTALKNYGNEHFSTITLYQILVQQKKLQSNILSRQYKAKTQIINQIIKKNIEFKASYNWEQQIMEIKLIKIKQQQIKILQEDSIIIELNMYKIKLLKQCFKQWIQICGTSYKINEQNMKKIINETSDKYVNKNIKKIQKIDLFTKTQQQVVSSSSDQEDIHAIQGKQAFLKFLIKDKNSNVSRTKTCRNTSKDQKSSRNL